WLGARSSWPRSAPTPSGSATGGWCARTARSSGVCAATPVPSWRGWPSPRPEAGLGHRPAGWDACRVRVTALGMLAVDGVPVRGRRLATAVRTLLDARGRPVSTATLVDAIWAGDSPRDTAGAVQALVSRIRRLGLPVVAA